MNNTCKSQNVTSNNHYPCKKSASHAPMLEMHCRCSRRTMHGTNPIMECPSGNAADSINPLDSISAAFTFNWSDVPLEGVSVSSVHDDVLNAREKKVKSKLENPILPPPRKIFTNSFHCNENFE